ncbi:NinX [Vibrio phage 1.173.O._10N.261.55.A11]|nr:NinX [Vibrio phage 1.173.O._10N.261.55.A11]
MNYEDMSDFEINKEVARVTDFDWHRDGSVVFKDNKNGDAKEFDPCNNPSDAWPIIFQHGICLTSPTTGRKHQLWSASWNEDGDRWSHGDITHGDKNPLRAAMICFLKMRDSEQK